MVLLADLNIGSKIHVQLPPDRIVALLRGLHARPPPFRPVASLPVAPGDFLILKDGPAMDDGYEWEEGEGGHGHGQGHGSGNLDLGLAGLVCHRWTSRPKPHQVQLVKLEYKLTNAGGMVGEIYALHYLLRSTFLLNYGGVGGKNSTKTSPPRGGHKGKRPAPTHPVASTASASTPPGLSGFEWNVDEAVHPVDITVSRMNWQRETLLKLFKAESSSSVAAVAAGAAEIDPELVETFVAESQALLAGEQERIARMLREQEEALAKWQTALQQIDQCNNLADLDQYTPNL